MRLTSSAFTEGQRIPTVYTCDGENISPPLEFHDVPEGTVTLALICDDPDAPVGVWNHWLLFNLPPEHTGLEAGIPAQFDPIKKASHGLNKWKKAEYHGPCPPDDEEHRYYFSLYALDCRVNLKGGAAKSQIVRAMENHILASARLMGTYSRAGA